MNCRCRKDIKQKFMLIYLGITLFTLVYSLFFPNIRSNKKQNKIYLFTICSILVIFMGLRGENVGIDTRVSNDFYIRIANEHSFSSYINIINSAPIYSLFNKLLSFFCEEPWFLNIANAIIINSCFFYFIYQYSEYSVYSVYCYITMYFYLFSFNGTRQMIASALSILSFCFFDKHKRILALMVFILALGTHVTSFVFIPIFFLCNKKLKSSFYQFLLILLLISGVLFKIFYKYILIFIFKILPQYQKYGAWLQDGRFQAQGRNILVTIFYAIFLTLFIIIIYKYQIIHNNYCKIQWRLILPAAFGLILGSVFYKNALISGRVILYYTCFLVVIFPNFIEKFSRGKILLYWINGSCLLFLLYYQLHINYAGVVPYSFFWILN